MTLRASVSAARSADPHGGAVEVGAQPLVRVEAVAVDGVESPVHEAELGTDRRGAGQGAVDVDPHSVGSGDGRQARHRIERQRGRRPDRGDGGAGHQAGGAVGGDRALEGLGVHGVVSVAGHVADAVRGESGDPGALVDRRVGVAGGVDHEVCECRTRRRGQRPLPGGHERAQSRTGGRVLDHPARRRRRCGTAWAARTAPPASPSPGSPVRCRPGWRPTASPAPRDPTTAGRRGWTDRWPATGRRRRTRGPASG